MRNNAVTRTWSAWSFHRAAIRDGRWWTLVSRIFPASPSLFFLSPGRVWNFEGENRNWWDWKLTFVAKRHLAVMSSRKFWKLIGREEVLKRKYFDNVFFFCLGILATKILKWQRLIMSWRYVKFWEKDFWIGDEDF